MSLTLHFHPLSSYCQKVLIALYEAGTPFAPVVVNFADPESAAAFRKLWPVGKMPVLRDADRDQTVPESSIIIEYLGQHYPRRHGADPGRSGAGAAHAAGRPLLRQLCPRSDAADRRRPAAAGRTGRTRSASRRPRRC